MFKEWVCVLVWALLEEDPETDLNAYGLFKRKRTRVGFSDQKVVGDQDTSSLTLVGECSPADLGRGAGWRKSLLSRSLAMKANRRVG